MTPERPPEPSAAQYRAAAIALVFVALLTAGMIAVAWVDQLDGPLLIPLVAAYFLFNVGYVIAVVRGWLQTKAAKLGLTAIGLNFLAMLLSSILTVWTVLSVCAVITALAAAFLLLRDAGRARGLATDA